MLSICRTPRLEAACRLYIVQNASLAACAATCLSLLWGSQAGMHVAIYWTLVVLTIITGSISSLGAMGASLSVEREWTKALCASDSEALAQTNAVMKRIDLTCLIASPIAVGVVMTWRLDAAVVAITLWNITAWAPECYLLQRAQRASPALTAPKHASGKEGASTPRRSMWERAGQVFAGWGAYCAQPVAVPAFALALLYLTVMSFGTLMTAYLKWEGISEAGLSVYRG